MCCYCYLDVLLLRYKGRRHRAGLLFLPQAGVTTCRWPHVRVLAARKGEAKCKIEKEKEKEKGEREREIGGRGRSGRSRDSVLSRGIRCWNQGVRDRFGCSRETEKMYSFRSVYPLLVSLVAFRIIALQKPEQLLPVVAPNSALVNPLYLLHGTPC